MNMKTEESSCKVEADMKLSNETKQLTAGYRQHAIGSPESSALSV